MIKTGPLNVARKLVAEHGSNVPEDALEAAVEDINRRMGVHPGHPLAIDGIDVIEAIEHLSLEAASV